MEHSFKKQCSLILTSLFLLICCLPFQSFNKVLAGDNKNYSIKDLNVSADTIYPFENNGIAIFKKNDLYGIMDTNGTVILTPQFTSISSFEYGLAKVSKGTKWGIINSKGDVIVQPQFKDIGDFSENNIIAVNTDSGWGIINTSGKTIIEPTFDAVYSFENGFMRVRKDNKYGFIDGSGNMISNCIYDIAYNFQDGYAVVKKGNSWGLIDTKGNFREFGFDEMKSSILGMIPIREGDNWGLSDINGNIILKPQYTDISLLNKDLIKVCSNNGKYGIIDKNCTKILDTQYDSITPDGNNLFLIYKNSQYGVINSNGAIILSPQFDWIDTYREGKAIVKQGDTYGFIDTSGKITYKAQYSKICAFTEGLARVEENDKWGFINDSGDLVIQPVFDGALDFNEGYAAVEKNGDFSSSGASNISDPSRKYLKWGYIDRQGATVITYNFDSASSFNNGYALTIKNGSCSIIKNSDIKFIPNTTITDPFKVWKIKFSKSLKDKTTKDSDYNILNDINMTMTNNIKVTDSSGNYVDASFTFESPDTILINPPYNGYEPNENYTITVLSNGKYNIEDEDGNDLKPSVIKITFSITN